MVSLLAAAAGFALLLAARTLQGVANAFTTPLLLAALAASTPPARLGRTVGAFAAVQTALVLALVPLPQMARDASAAPPSLRDALNRPVRWLALAASPTSP